MYLLGPCNVRATGFVGLFFYFCVIFVNKLPAPLKKGRDWEVHNIIIHQNKSLLLEKYLSISLQDF